ncbi:MAG: hypothetical protein ACE5IL_16225 [Myxococcota bacterium]
MPEPPTDPSRLLRGALRANALFSGVSGVCALIAAAPLAEHLGVAPPVRVSSTGLDLVGFAGLLALVASRPRISPAWVTAILAADGLWVLGSAVLIPLGVFSLQGRWIIAILAEIVAALAILQYAGLRRMRRAAVGS